MQTFLIKNFLEKEYFEKSADFLKKCRLFCNETEQEKNIFSTFSCINALKCDSIWREIGKPV